MYPKRAIVREIPDTYTSCISSHPKLSSLSIESAREQHKEYVRTLKELSLEVIVMPKDNSYPDSCFVEDTTIIHGSKAFITRIGAESRQGEETSVSELLGEYKTIKSAEKPATIDGGDVIHLDNYLISGLSSRTNALGIKQASDFLDTRIKYIEDPNIVHLKSYVTYLGDDVMVTTDRFKNHEVLEGFEKILVTENEAYAANTLTIGSTVIMSENTLLQKSVRDYGFDTIVLQMDQFERCEGALSCLSILF
ncbi:MAG: hypothetical protein INQ03_19365 [Candidatus Heimdallarchaeota archaeon]|nr:hypothetical protein [Candidatus Heimdallarchaeota archaeon]